MAFRNFFERGRKESGSKPEKYELARKEFEKARERAKMIATTSDPRIEVGTPIYQKIMTAIDTVTPSEGDLEVIQRNPEEDITAYRFHERLYWQVEANPTFLDSLSAEESDICMRLFELIRGTFISRKASSTDKPLSEKLSPAEIDLLNDSIPPKELPNTENKN